MSYNPNHPRGPYRKKPIMDRIVEGSIPVPFTGCWLWLGYCGLEGYGRVSANQKMQLAHRASFEAFNGPIPTGLVIDHLCNVRCCVNPAHLAAVTQAENVRRSPAGGDRRSAAFEERSLWR